MVLGKLKVKNVTNACVSNDLEFNFTDQDQKHMIYKESIVFNCNSCLETMCTIRYSWLFAIIYFESTEGKVYGDVESSKGYTSELGAILFCIYI